MNNIINNFSLNVDEDQVLLEMFEFFDDLGLPDHIDQKAYETLQNKFFGMDVNYTNWEIDSNLQTVEKLSTSYCILVVCVL